MSNLHTLNGAGLNGSAALLLVLATFSGTAAASGAVEGARTCRGAWSQPAGATVTLSGSAQIPASFAGTVDSVGVFPPNAIRSAFYQATAGATGFAFLLREVPAFFGGDASAEGTFLPNAKLAYFDTTLGATGEIAGHLTRPGAWSAPAFNTASAWPGEVVRYVETDAVASASGRFEASYRASGDVFDQLDGYFSAVASATSEVPNDKVQVITGFITDLTSAGTATAYVEYRSTRFAESATATATVAPTRTGYGAFTGTDAVDLTFTPTLNHGGRFTSALSTLGGFSGRVTCAGRFNALADVVVSFSATYTHMTHANGVATATGAAWRPNEQGAFISDVATAVALGVVPTLTQTAAFAALASTEPGLMLPFTNQMVLGGRQMVIPAQERRMAAPYQLRTMVVPL